MQVYIIPSMKCILKKKREGYLDLTTLSISREEEQRVAENWMDLVFCYPILNFSILIYRERFGERTQI